MFELALLKDTKVIIIREEEVEEGEQQSFAVEKSLMVQDVIFDVDDLLLDGCSNFQLKASRQVLDGLEATACIVAMQENVENFDLIRKEEWPGAIFVPENLVKDVVRLDNGEVKFYEQAQKELDEYNDDWF